MLLSHHTFTCGIAFAIVLSACSNSNDPASAPASGFQPGTPSFAVAPATVSTLLGRALFTDSSETFKIKRMTGDWQVEVKWKPAVDVAVQSILFPSGSSSGWHSHPGPVFIQVVTGEMTFYESDDPECKPVIRRAGEGYLDAGDHAHIARNESGAPAQNIVTYFAPPGAALRINQPSPGNCPF